MIKEREIHIITSKCSSHLKNRWNVHVDIEETNYLPTLNGQTWTFGWPPTYPSHLVPSDYFKCPFSNFWEENIWCSLFTNSIITFHKKSKRVPSKIYEWLPHISVMLAWKVDLYFKGELKKHLNKVLWFFFWKIEIPKNFPENFLKELFLESNDSKRSRDLGLKKETDPIIVKNSIA